MSDNMKKEATALRTHNLFLSGEICCINIFTFSLVVHSCGWNYSSTTKSAAVLLAPTWQPSGYPLKNTKYAEV